MKILLIILLAVGLALACSNRLKVVRYQLASPKISRPIRLALLTDLHSCLYGREQRRLLKAILAQQPDLLLFAGDIYDDKFPGINTECLLANLQAAFPPDRSFLVSGNHEFRCVEPTPEEVLQIFRQYGVRVLQGECVNFAGLNICGVDDPTVSRHCLNETSIAQQLAEVGQADANGSFTILLAHRPERIKQYMWYGFDLVLCGHAHGGQWRIPGLLNGLFAPNQGLFPHYAGGLYHFPEGEMIVSRGLAKNHPLVPRIFNRPELVIIDLLPQAAPKS